MPSKVGRTTEYEMSVAVMEVAASQTWWLRVP